MIPFVRHIRPNFVQVGLPGLLVWFSYETPVAFQVDGGERIVRENDWGPTTGKHLNLLDGGASQSRARRFGSQAFTEALLAITQEKVQTD